MKALLKGKLTAQEFYNGAYYYIVSEAAKDVYSQPSSFRVKTPNQLGAVDSEVTLSIDISGFVKMKQYKDKQTGEMKSYPEQKYYLNAEIATPKELKQVS